MSAADNDMADKHGLPPKGEPLDYSKAKRGPAYLQGAPAPDQCIPLYMGYLVASLGKPEVHAWFLANGMADTDMQAAHRSLLRLAEAFYK